MQKMVAAAANTTPSLGRGHRFIEAGLLAAEALEDSTASVVPEVGSRRAPFCCAV